jgi:hypothetical protein
MTQIHPQYVVDAEGHRQSVLLPIEEFEELIECAQDVLDAAEIDRLRSEPKYSWAEVKSERVGLFSNPTP